MLCVLSAGKPQKTPWPALVQVVFLGSCLRAHRPQADRLALAAAGIHQALRCERSWPPGTSGFPVVRDGGGITSPAPTTQAWTGKQSSSREVISQYWTQASLLPKNKCQQRVRGDPCQVQACSPPLPDSHGHIHPHAPYSLTQVLGASQYNGSSRGL